MIEGFKLNSSASGLALETRGYPAQFQTTAWSRIQRTLQSDPKESGRALHELFQTYWQPVYLYLLHRYHLKSDEAKDFTQEFFTWTLETHFFEKADPKRGSFRAFLKTSLRNFMGNEFRRQIRDKRGGGTTHLSIDFSEESPVISLSQEATPEQIMDRQWREVLLNRALKELRSIFQSRGRGIVVDVFEDFHLGGKAYNEICSARGIQMSDVENHLGAARKRLREILIDLVSETVSSRELLEEELQQLFG